jgi:hypothetical protein
VANKSQLNLVGGACGFKHTNHYPFSSMTSCGNQPIFKDGKGCGACYQVSAFDRLSLAEAQISNHDINVSVGVLNWLNFPDTMPQD